MKIVIERVCQFVAALFIVCNILSVILSLLPDFYWRKWLFLAFCQGRENMWLRITFIFKTPTFIVLVTLLAIFILRNLEGRRYVYLYKDTDAWYRKHSAWNSITCGHLFYLLPSFHTLFGNNFWSIIIFELVSLSLNSQNVICGKISLWSPFIKLNSFLLTSL